MCSIVVKSKFDYNSSSSHYLISTETSRLTYHYGSTLAWKIIRRGPLSRVDHNKIGLVEPNVG